MTKEKSFGKSTLQYVEEDGTKLYGYSQINLDKLTRVGYILSTMFGILLMIMLYLLWWGHRYHVFTRLIRVLGG